MQTANANYPPIAHGTIRGNDDHTDAFRHAYWNARMTQLYGPEWAERYATAHETDASNPGPREAMDRTEAAVRQLAQNNVPGPPRPGDLSRNSRIARYWAIPLVVKNSGCLRTH